MEEIKEQPNYYSVLTAEVRYDKRLKPMEKILYSEITALLNMNGVCFASNKYFAKLYEVSEQSVSNWIGNLIKYGYFTVTYDLENSKRYLKLPKNNIPTQEVEKKDKKEKVAKKEVEQPKKKEEKKTLLEREPKNDIERVEKEYLQNYSELYKKKIVNTGKPIINWMQSRKLTKDCISQYGLEKILSAVNKAKDNEFCVQKGYCLTTILSSGVLSGLINGNNYSNKNIGFGTAQGVDKVTDDEVIF